MELYGSDDGLAWLVLVCVAHTGGVELVGWQSCLLHHARSKLAGLPQQAVGDLIRCIAFLCFCPLRAGAHRGSPGLAASAAGKASDGQEAVADKARGLPRARGGIPSQI